MHLTRRDFLAAGSLTTSTGVTALGPFGQAVGMHGLIGKMTAAPTLHRSTLARLFEGIVGRRQGAGLTPVKPQRGSRHRTAICQGSI